MTLQAFRRLCRIALALAAVAIWPLSSATAAEPIKLGAPLSTAYVYGYDAEQAMRLAIEEINAAGGVKVAGEMRPFEVEVIDTRDLEPGVPVDDAIKAVEKLILQRKVDFLVGGPVRSEAGLAVMDLLAEHKKVSILSTGVLSPAYHKTIAKNYDKYKYMFRRTWPTRGRRGRSSKNSSRRVVSRCWVTTSTPPAAQTSRPGS
jgi:branched-chain amino acid transport system substrate-binding protein